MGGSFSSWLDLFQDGLLAAWMMAAIFWAIAGIAAASWAGMNLSLGAILGAATLFIGCVGILIYGLATRDRRPGRVAGSAATAPGAAGLAGSGVTDSGFGGSGVTDSGFGAGFGNPGPADSGFGGSGHGGSGHGGSGYGGSGYGGSGSAASAFGAGFGTPAFNTSGFDATTSDRSAFGSFGAAATGPVVDPPSPAAGTGSRHRVPMTTIVIFSMIAVVVAGFAAALFTPWLTLSFGFELDGSEVALVPLLCTILAIGVASALSWRGPRRLPALVVVWFSSWWLLVGVLALTSGSHLAEVITTAGNEAVARLSLEQQLAGFSAVTIGLGVTLVALAGLLGVVWGALAVVRCAAGTTGWTS